MIYREFQGKQLSMLGLGAMRLPLCSKDDADIDVAKTKEMVAYAMEHGINYYDTAWGYHNGQSEIVLGEILNEYPRESYYLASKFPGYDISNMGKVEEIFEKQLEKTQKEYFDFYLFHNVCEINIDAYLDEKYGIFEYLMKQKENGRIRHLGFSAHGSLEVMERFLKKYGHAMEFCQLQINYIDWEFQKSREKVALVQSYGIPVWVMEPLRGGKLAKISEEYVAGLQELRPEESVPGWAFRFLQSLPEVTVVLSGMSNMEQLTANVKTFETDAPFSDEEMKHIKDMAAKMVGRIALPCTACRYCTSKCPKGLDIPTLLELYNEHIFTGGGFLPEFGLMAIEKEKHPDACIGCRGCEAVCPQQIKISEAMKDFADKMK
ncbi:MAG: oxidoreductase [Lachnospiraceae bacterium]|nr:oxidoreductase [Lachnospiraceae bacterium]